MQLLSAYDNSPSSQSCSSSDSQQAAVVLPAKRTGKESGLDVPVVTTYNEPKRPKLENHIK